MLKLRKNKKGFTLIELIVVIAILAILAIIAVPRLAGFRDRAEIANDKELASIVAHSVATLIASGDIKAQAGTVVVTNSATVPLLVYTPTTVVNNATPAVAYDAASLYTKLSTLVGTITNLKHITSATIVINADGEVPVSAITYVGD